MGAFKGVCGHRAAGVFRGGRIRGMGLGGGLEGWVGCAIKRTSGSNFGCSSHEDQMADNVWQYCWVAGLAYAHLDLERKKPTAQSIKNSGALSV